MIFLHQTSERTIQSLVRPHWRNALTATVNGFTGGAQIGYLVTAVTTGMKLGPKRCPTGLQETRRLRVKKI
jgi:hypothetical protein